MMVVFDPGDGKPLETLSMSRYAVGTTFKKAWDKETQPDQWKALSNLIQEKDPKKIGINKSLIESFPAMFLRASFIFIHLFLNGGFNIRCKTL